jgi:hypothetical protein
VTVKGKPRIEAYIGASGSGKGVSIARRLAELQAPRLLIWDPRAEYFKHGRAVSLQAAVQQVAASADGPFSLRIVHDGKTPPAAAFGLLCKLAFRAGNLLLLAEELSDVTTASLAPPAWRQCITQGRHQNLHVIGAAQRPALIDKTFLGNCTYIRCFTLRYEDDQRAMGKALNVPMADITALETIERPGGVTINFIERDFRARVLQKGQIKLGR